jgi:AcrR family transcriptional regulator
VTGPHVTAEGSFSMSELVERTGVPAATVRYYLVEGLLPPPVKVASNRFLYDERHVELVRLVRLLRERRGLSIEAIARVLPDLLPDLLGKPRGGIFRPNMWGEVLGSATPATSGASLVRDRLLEIGVERFSRHGYAEVTVDDVCRAADIAKGSFYRHFTSKEELFLAVAASVTARTSAAFVAFAGDRKVTPDEAVLALADVLADHLAVVLDLTSLAAQQRSGFAAALRALTSRVAGAVRPLLAGAGADEETEPRSSPLVGDPADEVLARAVFEGVRRVVTRTGEPPPRR